MYLAKMDPFRIVPLKLFFSHKTLNAQHIEKVELQ